MVEEAIVLFCGRNLPFGSAKVNSPIKNPKGLRGSWTTASIRTLSESDIRRVHHLRIVSPLTSRCTLEDSPVIPFVARQDSRYLESRRIELTRGYPQCSTGPNSTSSNGRTLCTTSDSSRGIPASGVQWTSTSTPLWEGISVYTLGLFKLLNNHYEVNFSPVTEKIWTDIRHHRNNIPLQLIQQLFKLFLHIVPVDFQAVHSILHMYLCVPVVPRELSIHNALTIVGGSRLLLQPLLNRVRTSREEL